MPFVSLAWLGTGVVIVDQLTQVVAGLAVFDPGVPAWRFQFGTLIAARIPPVAMVLLLAFAVAQWFERRQAARIILRMLATLVVLSVLVTVDLWLDGANAKGLVGASQLQSFVYGWIRVLILSVASSALGLAIWMAAKRQAR